MKCVLEYIWIGGNNELRSKIKVMDIDKERYLKMNIMGESFLLEDVPLWNFDGSSTNQANGLDTEVILKPVKIVKSPFISEGYNSFLVLCETNHQDRSKAKNLFDLKLEAKPWFGLEQEYFMVGNTEGETVMSSFTHNKVNQGPYYCGIGHGKHILERKIALEHLDACLYAGLEISGINAEVAHRQWEFQIGPCVGIDAADQMILARYILERIAEKYGVGINYDPKPFPRVNGSGCHVNFSTEEMRQDGGIRVIEDAIRKLGEHHEEMIDISGEGNDARLTGKHETSSMEEFSWGIGTRHTSVRIPNGVFNEGKGYFEDRRCAANINPYHATSTLFKLCCL